MDAALRQYWESLPCDDPHVVTAYVNFVSFMVDESAAGVTNAQNLLTFTEMIGLSVYPYVSVSSSAGGSTDPALFPSDSCSSFPGKF